MEENEVPGKTTKPPPNPKSLVIIIKRRDAIFTEYTTPQSLSYLAAVILARSDWSAGSTTPYVLSPSLVPSGALFWTIITLAFIIIVTTKSLKIYTFLLGLPLSQQHWLKSVKTPSKNEHRHLSLYWSDKSMHWVQSRQKNCQETEVKILK